MAGHQLLQHFGAGPLREREVEQDHVGLEPRHGLERGLAVRGDVDHLIVGLEHGLEPLAHEMMIFDQQYPRPRGGRLRLAGH